MGNRSPKPMLNSIQLEHSLPTLRGRENPFQAYTPRGFDSLPLCQV